MTERVVYEWPEGRDYWMTDEGELLTGVPVHRVVRSMQEERKVVLELIDKVTAIVNREVRADLSRQLDRMAHPVFLDSIDDPEQRDWLASRPPLPDRDEDWFWLVADWLLRLLDRSEKLPDLIDELADGVEEWNEVAREHQRKFKELLVFADLPADVVQAAADAWAGDEP